MGYSSRFGGDDSTHGSPNVLPATLRRLQKSGVSSLTQSLAIEWARYGVRVNAILPCVIRTSLNAKLLDGTARGQEFLLRNPMKRFGKPEEFAGAAVFLASDAAACVTGEILRVDGGVLASGVNQ